MKSWLKYVVVIGLMSIGAGIWLHLCRDRVTSDVMLGSPGDLLVYDQRMAFLAENADKIVLQLTEHAPPDSIMSDKPQEIEDRETIHDLLEMKFQVLQGHTRVRVISTWKSMRG